MRKFLYNIQQIMPLVHNTHLPAVIFALAFLGFHLYGNIAEQSMLTLHWTFFALVLCNLFVLTYFNQRTTFFYILSILCSYILINLFKQNYSLDYLSSPAYLNLCFFIPINLLCFNFYPKQKLKTISTIYWLLAIFAEYTCAEQFTRRNISPIINFSTDSINLNSISVYLFILLLTCTFIRMVKSGTILDSALFWSNLNIFSGFYYSSSATALCIFFCAATFTTLVAVLKNIYFTTYTDMVTGLGSRNAYLKQAPNFPLKYSLGIICIDKYHHFKHIFGQSNINLITSMIAQRMQDIESECQFYRYGEDTFVLIFKNEDKNKSFERMENLRRAIASSEFIFNKHRKGLKLTVSGCVSEKKRSDDNSLEVLYRAHKALQKTYQFTQNVTSKA